MTISALESEIAIAQRRKCASRIGLAVESILRSCGVKIVTARPPKPSVSRNNVYRVEGYEGDIVGAEALRVWLFDRGVKRLCASTVSNAVKSGREIGGFRISLVGTVRRNNKSVKFHNPEAA